MIKSEESFIKKKKVGEQICFNNKINNSVIII